MHKILLIDDESDILALLQGVLRREGFTAIAQAETGSTAIERCRQFAPDIIVLDIMLPDMDGYEVCRAIREFSKAPVLFLSSRGDEVDKILGLAIGGDDYITKPFSPREMVYRIKAQLRRLEYQRRPGHIDAEKPLQIGALRVNPAA